MASRSAALQPRLPPQRRFWSIVKPRASRERDVRAFAQSQALGHAPRVQQQATRANFLEVLPAVREALQSCRFYSFDCEMTGLYTDNSREDPLDDYETRYEKAALSAEQFLITQFGISAFCWVDGGWQAKTFNFYVFPRVTDDFDRRFLCQASSIEFLASHGFDFNRCFYEGIQYLPLAKRDAKMREARAATPQDDGELLIASEREREYAGALVAEVQAWLDDPARPPALLLSPASPQQQRLQDRVLRRTRFRCADPPGFIAARQTLDGGQVTRLVRASAAEVAAAAAQEAWGQEEEANRAAGVSLLLEAMRECGRPGVGHNISFDLAFMLGHFAGELPDRWGGARGGLLLGEPAGGCRGLLAAAGGWRLLRAAGG
jgi:poly(A)-specific ribonuclease